MTSMQEKARELLGELNTAKGPEMLAAWNIKAKTCLVFSAIEQLRTSKTVVPDMTPKLRKDKQCG